MIEKLVNHLKENFIGKDIVVEVHGSISCLVSLEDIKNISFTQHEVFLEGQSQNFTIWTENIDEINYESKEFDDDDANLYIGFKDGLGIWFNILEDITQPQRREPDERLN